VKAGSMDELSGDWQVTLLDRSDGTQDVLNNDVLWVAYDDELGYGKISQELPGSGITMGSMHDIMIEHREPGEQDWHIVDIEPHCLQLIEDYDSTPKFVQITDIHVGEMGAERDLVKLIAALNSDDDIDFVIVSGDITHGSQPQGDLGEGLEQWWDMRYLKVENEWKVVWHLFQQFDMPVFVSPGNHDYYDDFIGGADPKGSIDEDLSYFHQYLLPEFKDKVEYIGVPYWEEDSDYSFSYSDYHFVSVNSGKPKNADRLKIVLDGFTENQLEWIKADYLDAGEKHTFVFTHAPVVSDHEKLWFDDWTHESPNDYHFVQWVEREKPDIEVVFCGHTHERRYYNNIYIGEEEQQGNPVDDRYIEWQTRYYPKTVPYDFSSSMLVTELG